MSRHDSRKSPAQIEREIEETRAEIGRSLDTLKERLSPGQLLDSFLGTSRAGPALMQQGLTRTFRDYPVPAALVGAGLWMMLTGRTGMKPEVATSTGDAASTSGGLGAFAGKVADKVKSMTGGATSRATELRDTVTDKATQLRDDVTEKAASLRDQATELTDQAREKLHDTEDQVRGKFDEARDKMRGYADAVSDRIPTRAEAKDRMRGGVDAAQAFITDYPLVAGALIAAVGGVVASMLPMSERERALLAGQGRKLRGVADDAMAQGKTALGHVAEAAETKMREEIGAISERAKQGGNATVPAL